MATIIDPSVAHSRRTIEYRIDVSVATLIEYAFDHKSGLDGKDLLLDEIEYNAEPFIERMKEEFSLPEEDDVLYDIDLDEWENIAERVDMIDDSFWDVDDGRDGGYAYVTLVSNITVDVDEFEKAYDRHDISIEEENNYEPNRGE